MATDWFGTTSGASLEQGDVILDCPIFRVVATPGENAEVIQEDHDIIVLTQTCDLENDKVDDVLVAVVLSYAHLVATDSKGHIKSSKFRKAAVDGNLPSYFLLPARTDPPPLDWCLVDFHNVFSVPKPLLSDVAGDRGDRLRLVSPYKEHLAQAFARYIMRVGLPTRLSEFEKFDGQVAGA